MNTATLDSRSNHDTELRAGQHQPWRYRADDHIEAFREALRFAPEQRDMTEALATGGGYFVPQQFHDELIAMLKAVDKLFDPNIVMFIETDSGAPLQIPFIDDTANEATIVAEGQQSLAVDVPVGNTTLPIAPTWRSSMVKASIELIQDSGYPLEQVLQQSFAIRLARGIGAANVATLLNQATLGYGPAIGTAPNDGGSETGGTSIGSQDLEALIKSVDDAYRVSPKCRWAMNQNTLSFILKTLDKYGRPIYPRERNAAGEVILLGYPVAICPSMPAIGLSATPVVFGDLGRFLVRVAKNATRLRIHREQYVTYGQVAFEAFVRSNATLAISTGSDSPIKYLQNAAS
jgi:HK97 family phage major capsid protein